MVKYPTRLDFVAWKFHAKKSNLVGYFTSRARAEQEQSKSRTEEE